MGSIASIFPSQVSAGSFTQDIFYAIATVCLLFVVAAIGLIDAGLVRRKNLLDTWIQKLVCVFLAGAGMAIVGYAVWEMQFYQAFGIPNPISQSLHDWWLFGPAMTHFSQNLNPTDFPTADVYQIFLVFFVAFAMVGGALLHSAGLERVKAIPMYIISLIAGTVLIPVLAYYTWGSTSPLTRHGVHDYIGVYSLYVFVGVWALILAWRAGPRIGAFTKDPRTMGPIPHNLSWSATGVGVLLFAAPFAFLGCGYFVPGSGYYGISLTTSGFGLVFINIFMAYIGGGLGGALISYRTKNPIMAVIGAAAGYIGAGTSLDVAKPWEILIISFVAAFVVWGVYQLLYKLRIDDKKVVPLTLGGGAYSVLVAGIVGAGKKTGGYFGLTGKYAPQHESITFGWQLIALAIVVGISLITGLIVIVGLEKTIGLRVSEKAEIEGLDEHYWSAPPAPYADHPVTAPLGGPEATREPVNGDMPVTAPVPHPA
jgi:Amt family ammonium transporter